jgi:hypothetical protein
MSDSGTERKMTSALTRFSKYLYWILGIILIGGLSYFFYNNLQRQIAGVLFFMVGVIILYFYYVKWFVVPETKPGWSSYSTPCPDYLTVLADAKGNAPGTPYKCFDFVGISRRPDGLKKADPRMINVQKNNPQFYFQVNPNENRESLRQRVLARGLTWNSLFGSD